MDLDALKKIAGVTPIEQQYHARPTRTKADDIAYLRSKISDADDQTLDMMRFYLILADTKSITGVDVFEEKPEDFDAFMAQYKLWVVLKA
jgi:hypothetical protein